MAVVVRLASSVVGLDDRDATVAIDRHERPVGRRALGGLEAREAGCVAGVAPEARAVARRPARDVRALLLRRARPLAERRRRRPGDRRERRVGVADAGVAGVGGAHARVGLRHGRRQRRRCAIERDVRIRGPVVGVDEEDVALLVGPPHVVADPGRDGAVRFEREGRANGVKRREGRTVGRACSRKERSWVVVEVAGVVRQVESAVVLADEHRVHRVRHDARIEDARSGVDGLAGVPRVRDPHLRHRMLNRPEGTAPPPVVPPSAPRGVSPYSIHTSLP